MRVTEHLFSALAGLRIWGVELAFSAEEVPFLDGSAAPWCEAIAQAAPTYQNRPPRWSVPPGHLGGEDHHFLWYPAPEFSIHYALADRQLGRWHFRFRWSPEAYRSEVAPARSFIGEKAFRRLARLYRGAHPGSGILFRGRNPLNTTLRYPEEPARHKVLDLLGDLYPEILLFQPFCLLAWRTGHRANHALRRHLIPAVGAPG